MSNTIVIPARTISKSLEPRVTLTSPRGGKKIRFAFNPALVEKMGLADFTHVTIEHDVEKRHLRFRPLTEAFDEGVPAHRLQTDGDSPSRMVLARRDAFDFLTMGYYDVHMLRNGAGFAIHYGED